jgi:hypothetical protein
MTNLKTHTGAVHAPGSFFRAIAGIGPKCAASANALMRYHYIIPTEDEVTCKRCLARLAKEA